MSFNKFIIFTDNDAAWSNALSNITPKSYLNDASWANVMNAQGWNTLRFVCQEEHKIYYAVQVFYKKIIFNTVIVWVPDCNFSNKNINYLLKNTIKDYFNSNRIYLRVRSHDDFNASDHINLLHNDWQKPRYPLGTGLTMVLDLQNPNFRIPGSFSKKWRQSLKRSFEFDHQIVELTKKNGCIRFIL